MAGFQDDSDKKVEPEEVESTSINSPKPRTFGGKVKRHCARFWWLHLIIFCIVFLIIALCLVYVAMPKIAQDGVNDSSLEITELDFTDPTPDTVVMTQKGILHSPSMYTPTLDPFNASTYLVTNGTYGAEPMVVVAMPRIHAHHPQSAVSVEKQKVSILSLDQLSAYTTAVLSQEYVTTALVGKTKLHLGSLPDTTIHYNQTSTYKGLNGLAGFNVTGVKIDLTAKPGKPNLSGFAYIPNASNFSIVMGNVTMSLLAGADTLGNATINDMTLVPGNNTLPMTGILDQSLVLKNTNTTGFLEMEIIGQSAVYNGEHLVYYERALASNHLRLAMNVNQILKDSI
ncbi:hypothetical protein ACMFMG_010658 [Clarireedia jacksonii]